MSFEPTTADEPRRRVSVDTDRCEGHGRCAALAPDVFTLDDLGFGVVLHHDEDLPAHAAQARRAAAGCPERAITLEMQ